MRPRSLFVAMLALMIPIATGCASRGPEGSAISPSGKPLAQTPKNYVPVPQAQRRAMRKAKG